jgi:hypothetical protein
MLSALDQEGGMHRLVDRICGTGDRTVAVAVARDAAAGTRDRLALLDAGPLVARMPYGHRVAWGVDRAGERFLTVSQSTRYADRVYLDRAALEADRVVFRQSMHPVRRAWAIAMVGAVLVAALAGTIAMPDGHLWNVAFIVCWPVLARKWVDRWRDDDEWAVRAWLRESPSPVPAPEL